MAATEDPVRQAVGLDNLIQEYMQFEKVSWRMSTFLCGHAFRLSRLHVMIEFLFLRYFQCSVTVQ